MAGLIFNFGEVGNLINSDDPDDFRYEVKLLEGHPDPDFVHWTFGDYPTSKGNMKSLKVGDYIFFNTTLKNPSTKELLKYFIGYMKISEIITLAELLEIYNDDQLKILSPYCYNAHIGRHLYEEGESLDCTFFVGEPSESRVVSDPIPFDRTLFQELYTRFNPEVNGDNESYNWYYNDPDYANRFGIKEDKNDKLLTDNSIINSKFKNPPYIPNNLANYLKKIIDAKDELTTPSLDFCGFDFDCADVGEILELSLDIWKSVPRQSIIDIIDVLPYEAANSMASDFMQIFSDEEEFSYELYEIFLDFADEENIIEISIDGKMVKVHNGIKWLPLKLWNKMTPEELDDTLSKEIFME